MLDSVLDGSVHVGVKNMQEGSLTKLDAAEQNNPAAPQLTGAEMEELEMLRKAVEDLKWKLGYDKGVYEEMTELLEKKAA